MRELNGNPRASQVLITAGALSQALSHHAANTQHQADGLLTGMNSLLQVFLGHLDKLHSDAESKSIVADLRAAIDSALRHGKLEEAREVSAERLAELTKHAAARRQQFLELTDRLQDRVTVLEQSTGMTPVMTQAGSSAADPCTGLAVRVQAEEAMRRAINQEPQAYMAVFYLHRMQLTNARFGEAIGNQVILFCSQHIATTVLRPRDSLFRWTGPAFVAIIERAESHPTVASEIQRWMSAPLSRFFETPMRSVYLPVKVTSEVVPLFETNLAEVLGAIDQFIGKTSGQLTAA
jgi:GGDEF domain-containing protein